MFVFMFYFIVPLLDSTVQGKRVAVFDPRIRKSNPMSAVHFKNTSGFQIEEGPAYIEEGNFVFL